MTELVPVLELLIVKFNVITLSHPIEFVNITISVLFDVVYSCPFNGHKYESQFSCISTLDELLLIVKFKKAILSHPKLLVRVVS